MARVMDFALEDKYVDDFVHSVEVIIKAAGVRQNDFCNDCGISRQQWNYIKNHKTRLRISTVNSMSFIINEIAFGNWHKGYEKDDIDKAFEKINEIMWTIDYKSFNKTRGL